MLFSYKIFKFSRLFSQHPNKFYYRKFQNYSQILIHGTNHSQIPTPHTTETPIQPTATNFGNQKPQPPKHHYHTTTTTKIKIIERDRWVEGEIERRRDRAAWCAVRLARSSACDRQTGAWGSPATSKAWSRLSLSLSLSLPASLTRKWFEVKIWVSNHFRGQRLIFLVNFK